MTDSNKLNLGCGTKILSGFVNVDLRSDVGADMVFDLRNFPWPWRDNSVNEICMNHILEHLPETETTIKEIRRILKPDGVLRGRVPFAMSEAAFTEPTHVRYFHWRSFTDMEQWGFKTSVRLICENVSLKKHLRCLIPFRSFLSNWLWNMFDAVEFQLVKIK
jgi:predicted SAM-dependent methyltransferase